MRAHTILNLVGIRRQWRDFFFQAEDGIRDYKVTGVQTCALPISQLLAANGLKRGDNELKLIMMCEVPSSAILADEFLEFFDGFSIGSNDLTQLTLEIGRASCRERV